MHSADEVLPRYQGLKVGDELPMGSGRPEGESTRLISRNRIATSGMPPVPRLFYTLFLEPGSLVMERKMLLGIKWRAEGLAQNKGT